MQTPKVEEAPQSIPALARIFGTAPKDNNWLLTCVCLKAMRAGQIYYRKEIEEWSHNN